METVLQSLQRLTMLQREEVFCLWGMGDTTDKEYNIRVGILLQRVKDPTCARFAWEQLLPEECQFLYQLLGHAERKGIELDTIQTKLHLPLEHFAAILTKLERLLLLQKKQSKARARVRAARHLRSQQKQ